LDLDRRLGLGALFARALAVLVAGGDELIEQVATLGLAAQVAHDEVGGLLEGFFVAEAVAGALGDLLAAGGEVFLEGLGVAGELGAELLDLGAQVFGGGVAGGA